MSVKKEYKGKCKLCGEHKTLNLEHVPPRSAFNKTTKYVVTPYIEKLQEEDPFSYKPKGKVEQGGVTFHSFCTTCNNTLGNNYVNAYKDWAYSGASVLNQAKNDIVGFEVDDINVNKVLKHIVSMFIAINGDWFVEEYSELVSFIKDPSIRELNSRFRIFAYLNRGPAFRYLGFLVHGDFSSGKMQMVKCSEIAFPPFGYILTIDHEGPLYNLADITHFKANNPDKLTKVSAQISIRETAIELPMDFRTEDEIKQSINKQSIEMNQMKDPLFTQRLEEKFKSLDFDISEKEGSILSIINQSVKTYQIDKRLLDLTIPQRDRKVKIPKSDWNYELPQNLYVVLVIILEDIEPTLFLIPTSVFKEPDNYIFFDNAQSERFEHLSNWEIKVFGKGIEKLSDYSFDRVVGELK
jgi:hypothetical protein